MQLLSVTRQIPTISYRAFFIKRSFSICYKENISKNLVLRPLHNLKYKNCYNILCNIDIRYSTLEFNKKDYRDKKLRKYNIEDKDFLNENSYSFEEWENIVTEQTKTRYFKREAFETQLVQECQKLNHLSLVDSYIEYLDKKSETLNLAARINYLKLLGANISSVGEEKFRNLYDELLREDYLPVTAIHYLVEALSMTKFWQEGQDLLNKIEERGELHFLSHPQNSYIRALLREKGFMETYHYIKKIDVVKSHFCLENDTQISLINSFKFNEEESCENRKVEMLFNLFAELNLSLSPSVAEKFANTFSSTWKISKVHIKNRSICHCCGGDLKVISMDQNTVTQLKEMFATNAVEDSDIFKSSTPEEWESFLTFLKKRAPFDIVIDGLNVLSGIPVRQGRRLIETLIKGNPSPKVLLVGRDHLKFNLRKIFPPQNQPKNLSYYFIDNVSKDDGFIIYAALYSGLGTKIISKDFLRNHKFKMGDAILGKKFLDWQKLHQVLVFGRNETAPIRLQEPYTYERVTQWNADSQAWHVPVTATVAKPYITDNMDWLCVRKKNFVRPSLFEN